MVCSPRKLQKESLNDDGEGGKYDWGRRWVKFTDDPSSFHRNNRCACKGLHGDWSQFAPHVHK